MTKDQLGILIAEYILNDRELSDYERHCEENKLIPFQYGHNHIASIAAEYLFKSGVNMPDWSFPDSDGPNYSQNGN